MTTNTEFALKIACGPRIHNAALPKSLTLSSDTEYDTRAVFVVRGSSAVAIYRVKSQRRGTFGRDRQSYVIASFERVSNTAYDTLRD